jgi:CheY-like chemotaxis protein
MATVLVIDDEPDIRRFLSRALVGHGFFVDCAPDGSSGVALAKTGRYQLVVLDLLLPDEHGVSVLKAIVMARVRARMRETDAPPPERFLHVGAVTLDLQRHVAEIERRQSPCRCASSSSCRS